MKLFGLNITRQRRNIASPFGGLPKEAAMNAAALLMRMNQPRAAQALVGRRALSELNEKMIRSYESARTSPYNLDFSGTYASGDAEIFTSLYTSRARARTLEKDEPHAKGILRSIMNNVIGHRAFRLKMRIGKKDANGVFVPDESLNELIESEYEIAGRPENFAVSQDISRMEAYRIMACSAVRDGSVLLRHWPAYPHNRYGYAAQLLENDRLQETYNGRNDKTGNQIRFSIEVDQWRRPVTYWLLTRHPGDPFGWDVPDRQLWREPVPAERIIFYRNLRTRAEQMLGMTEFDSVIQYLHRDRQYESALALAAIASCCKPFSIEKMFPTGMSFTAEEFAALWAKATATNQGPESTNGEGASSGIIGKQQRIGTRTNVDMPASTLELEWGETLKQNDPRFPMEAAHNFKADNMRSAAIGMGVSYQTVSGDFQNLGFSASRSCEIPQRDNYKVMQQNFIDVVCRPHFREWMRCSIMAGVIPVPLSRLDEIINAASWKGVRWPFINPLQDVQATILQLEAGLISPQQVQDELEDGISIDDLYALQAEALLAQKKHGLDWSQVDVTRPTISKGEPGQGVQPPDVAGAQPPPKTKTTNPVRRRGISETTRAILSMTDDGRNGFHH